MRENSTAPTPRGDTPAAPMGRPARLYYRYASFDILGPGDHVLCAVTGVRIHLSQLRYWCAHAQEAYVSPEAALEGHKAVRAPNGAGAPQA